MWAGRLSSRCSNGPQTSRPVTEVDWYGCDTLEQSRRPSLTRPHSVIGDGRMSPTWCAHSSSTKLHTNTPDVSRQSSARARHERQRQHYIETGVDEPRYDDNDLLERHRQWFCKEQLFTPRTLQSSQVSRLSAMSTCYRNPRRNRSRVASQDHADNCNQSNQSDSPPGTSQAMSDKFAYDTLRSRPGRRHEAPNEVPPLGISLDPDQIKYLKQHSDRQEYETVAEADVNKMQVDHGMSGTARRNMASLMATKQQL